MGTFFTIPVKGRHIDDRVLIVILSIMDVIVRCDVGSDVNHQEIIHFIDQFSHGPTPVPNMEGIELISHHRCDYNWRITVPQSLSHFLEQSFCVEVIYLLNLSPNSL